MKSRKKFLVSLLALLSVGVMSLSATACELDDLQGLLDGADIDVNVNVGENPDDGTTDDGTDDDGSTADGGTTNDGTIGGGTGGNGGADLSDTEKSKVWEEYFKYELNSDGESYTVRIFNEEDMNGGVDPEISSITAPLVIPDTYNNLPITTIGDYAFIFLATESVTIPNSITSIGLASFGGCSNIKDVVIPDSVVSMGGSVFASCANLKNVTIGNAVTNISVNMFAMCMNLEKINIGNSVSIIDDYAFFECRKLSSIIIPNSVVSIGFYSFGGCSSLTSIIILDSVASIGDCAFARCRSLTSITIPDSVTSIGYSAFADCESLTSITFEGTIAQWNAIEKDEDFWNENVPATKVVCSDGEVAL